MSASEAELKRLREAGGAGPPTAAEASPPSLPSDVAVELEQLRAEVNELRQFKAKQEAPMQPTPSIQPGQPAFSAEAAALIVELHGVCGQTCQTLAEAVPGAEDGAISEASPEAGLRRLRDVCLAAHAGAQRSSDEQRRLVAKLAEVETSAEAAAVAAAAAMTAATSLAPTAPTEPQPTPAAAEVLAAAQQPARQAALALREVRVNAERQLAWIGKRIKMHKAGNGIA